MYLRGFILAGDFMGEKNKDQEVDFENQVTGKFGGLNWLWLLVGFGFIFFSKYFSTLKIVPLIDWFGRDLAITTVQISHLGGDILKELGFAILVAVFVGFLIEVGHRKGITKILNDRIGHFLEAFKDENNAARHDLERDAFSAVFKKNLPNGYVDEVMKTTFDIKVMRSNFDVTYVFEDLPETQEFSKLREYMVLICTLKCKTENISDEITQIPFNLHLPNPRNEALQHLVKVEEWKSGANHYQSTPLSKEELDKGNESMQDCFSRGESNGEFPAPVKELNSGKAMYHEIKYQLVKEGEDNETFRTRHASSNMKITVFDRTKGRDLYVDGEVIHSDTFTSRPDGDGETTVHVFDLNRWLLPHQGIIIFWKNRLAANYKGKD